MNELPETDIRQISPPKKGIYPVTLLNGERTCALWDNGLWFIWSDIFDPPCWDQIEWMNTKVINWRMP